MRAKTILRTISLASLLASSTMASAFPGFTLFGATSDYTQVISVNNALANRPNEVNMTRTPIHIDYFTKGSSERCWWNELQFGEGVTIHAGADQGCKTKVERVIIKPIIQAGKVGAYDNAFELRLDEGAFSNMITVKQATAPVFNSETGLVEKSGKLTATTAVAFR